MVFRFLLRPDLVIVRPVVFLAMATAKPDCPAAFLRRVREMDFRRVVAAVSFAARSWPVADLSVVAFDSCRCPICFATAGFVPAADPFGPADSDFDWARPRLDGPARPRRRDRIADRRSDALVPTPPDRQSQGRHYSGLLG